MTGERKSLPSSYIQALEDLLQIRLNDPIPSELSRFATTIGELASALNREPARKELTNRVYLDEADALEAYLLYYTSANLLKIHHPLHELNMSGFFNRERVRVLDLGSGTGTMMLGTDFWRESYHPDLFADYTAIDQSAEALRLASDLMSKLGRSVSCRVSDVADFSDQLDPFDLITTGHLLNELDGAEFERFLQLVDRYLSPHGFLICLEPALRSTSRYLLQFRNLLLNKGWFVYSPCFTHRACPALENPADWCHTTMHWDRPRFMAILDEMVGHVKKSLKYSYMIFSRQNVHLGDFLLGGRDFNLQFRVVSELIKEKGRRRVYFCNDGGRVEFMKNKRDNAEPNAAFDQLNRYDVVALADYEIRANLGRVGKSTEVRPVIQPGEPPDAA